MAFEGGRKKTKDIKLDQSFWMLNKPISEKGVNTSTLNIIIFGFENQISLLMNAQNVKAFSHKNEFL